jgi:hypothetical protein
MRDIINNKKNFIDKTIIHTKNKVQMEFESSDSNSSLPIEVHEQQLVSQDQ